MATRIKLHDSSQSSRYPRELSGGHLRLFGSNNHRSGTTIQTGPIDINCPPRDLFFSLSYPVSPAVARRTQFEQCLLHPG